MIQFLLFIVISFKLNNGKFLLIEVGEESKEQKHVVNKGFCVDKQKVNFPQYEIMLNFKTWKNFMNFLVAMR